MAAMMTLLAGEKFMFDYMTHPITATVADIEFDEGSFLKKPRIIVYAQATEHEQGHDKIIPEIIMDGIGRMIQHHIMSKVQPFLNIKYDIRVIVTEVR